MKLTRELIMEGRTPNGAWNKHQLATLGISWPPERGWIDRLQGKEIEAASYAEFVRLARITRPERRERNQAMKAGMFHSKPVFRD